MPYSIFIASPDNYPHSHAFDDVAMSLQWAFRDLGYPVPIVSDPAAIRGTPIILGAALLDIIPHSNLMQPIIYNLEQIQNGSPWMSDKYIDNLRHNIVWDYSVANIAALDDMEIRAKHCPIGYMPILSTIALAPKQDIDVLHYGSVNERRWDIIKSLQDAGVNVHSAFNVYGKERDDLIARSKIVLNVHYYETKVFEIVRCSYLMANTICIVSEEGNDFNIESQYREGVKFSPYDKLVESCISLLADKDLRDKIAQTGFDIFSKQSQVDFLKAVL